MLYTNKRSLQHITTSFGGSIVSNFNFRRLCCILQAMNDAKRSGWSFNLFKISNIPVRMHASFILLLLWVGFNESGPAGVALTEVLFVLSIFGCVLLHELGHTTVAHLFDVKTSSITLYPFGGIAQIESSPTPKAELAIAAAGPAVNFIIAAFLFFSIEPPILGDGTEALGFSTRLLIANLVLAIFNLLPAIPMDGGRILRAGLALLKIKHATTIAARISQILSLLMGAFALYIGDAILLVIAVFVLMNAFQEQWHARSLSIAKDLRVKNVMTSIEDLTLLEHGMTVSQAMELAKHCSQTAFPVLHGQTVLGIVMRNSLVHASTKDDECYLSEIMNREYPTTNPEELLVRIIERMQSGATLPFVVLQNERFVGMLLEELLVDFLFSKKAAKDPVSKGVPA